MLLYTYTMIACSPLAVHIIKKKKKSSNRLIVKDVARWEGSYMETTFGRKGVSGRNPSSQHVDQICVRVFLPTLFV